MKTKENKKIHLISIAAEYRGIEDICVPPSGCLYVGDALKKSGYTVTVHHLYSKQIEETVSSILEGQPLFVGFSVLTGSPVVQSARMSRLIKAASPETPIVWGGIHSSLVPEACLREKTIDFVIRGEGEISVVELADYLANGGEIQSIDGLGWKDVEGNISLNKERQFIKDIDQFRQDWTLVDPKRYVRKALDGTKTLNFITSRGCPHNCGFCYNLVFNKRRWRAHSVDFVVDEIEKLHQLTGVDCFVFNDDNFLVNVPRAFEILERLQEKNICVSWLEVRLDRVNESILERLKKLGVKTLFVGWESGSNKTLKQIDKGFDTSMITNYFKLAAKYSFNVDASAIVGFPFETKEDWSKTIDMALEIDAINPGRNKFNVGVYVPYPGTPIVQEAFSRGFKFPDNIMDWDSFDILKGKMKLPWISPAQVQLIARVDSYAKMLFVGDQNAQCLSTLIRKMFASAARFRLKFKIFFLPFEAILYDKLVKIYLLKSRKDIPGS